MLFRSDSSPRVPAPARVLLRRLAGHGGRFRSPFAPQPQKQEGKGGRTLGCPVRAISELSGPKEWVPMAKLQSEVCVGRKIYFSLEIWDL